MTLGDNTWGDSSPFNPGSEKDNSDTNSGSDADLEARVSELEDAADRLLEMQAAIAEALDADDSEKNRSASKVWVGGEN